MIKIIFACFMLFLCSGCVLITDKIDIPYQSIARQVTIMPDAVNTTIWVTTSDARTTYRDRVSSKKNGYGMEMAAILPTNDLSVTVTNAFRGELAARGFKIASNGGMLKVQIVRFYNDFKNGFFSGDALATVAFNVTVESSQSHILFSKYYEGSGTEPNIQIAGGDNARAALIKALQNALGSVLADEDFLHALVAAGMPSPLS